MAQFAVDWFGVVAPGRPVVSNFVMVDSAKCTALVERPADIGELCFFLLPRCQLPPATCAVLAPEKYYAFRVLVPVMGLVLARRDALVLLGWQICALLLTGTPLQNNLGELWALLQFVLPTALGDSKLDDERKLPKHRRPAGGFEGADDDAHLDLDRVSEARALLKQRRSDCIQGHWALCAKALLRALGRSVFAEGPLGDFALQTLCLVGVCDDGNDSPNRFFDPFDAPGLVAMVSA